MPIAQIIALLAQYGPAVLPLIHQLVQWAEEKKTTVTADDIKLIISYGSLSEGEYLALAGGAPVSRPT